MKTILPILILGATICTSCASLVAFNAQYTEPASNNVTYAAPASTVQTEADSTEASMEAATEFYDDDYYYSRRLMSSYDPTWDVSFRIGGPYWSIGYGYYPYRYYYGYDYWYPYSYPSDSY